MPTYEYLCQSCGARFEVWQKMTDDPLTTCNTCGGPIRRVVFPAGIVFKGGGFYSTDHRANGAAAATSSSEATTGESSSGEKKSETPAPAAVESKGAGSGPGGSTSNTTSGS